MNVHRAGEAVRSEEQALFVLDNFYRTGLDSRNCCAPINTTRNDGRNECGESNALPFIRIDSGSNYDIPPRKRASANRLITQYGHRTSAFGAHNVVTDTQRYNWLERRRSVAVWALGPHGRQVPALPSPAGRPSPSPLLNLFTAKFLYESGGENGNCTAELSGG